MYFAQISNNFCIHSVVWTVAHCSNWGPSTSRIEAGHRPLCWDTDYFCAFLLSCDFVFLNIHNIKNIQLQWDGGYKEVYIKALSGYHNPYLFFSWIFRISFVCWRSCFSSLYVDNEFSSSCISSRDVWFSTLKQFLKSKFQSQRK